MDVVGVDYKNILTKNAKNNNKLCSKIKVFNPN
jgi:hypothetical protein